MIKESIIEKSKKLAAAGLLILFFMLIVGCFVGSPVVVSIAAIGLYCVFCAAALYVIGMTVARMIIDIGFFILKNRNRQKVEMENGLLKSPDAKNLETKASLPLSDKIILGVLPKGIQANIASRVQHCRPKTSFDSEIQSDFETSSDETLQKQNQSITSRAISALLWKVLPYKTCNKIAGMNVPPVLQPT